MKAIKCDWCGKFRAYDPNKYTSIQFVDIFCPETLTEPIDLCEECVAAIDTLVEQRRKSDG